MGNSVKPLFLFGSSAAGGRRGLASMDGAGQTTKSATTRANAATSTAATVGLWRLAVELQVQYLLQLSDVYESLGKHQQQQEVAERGLALLGERRDLITIDFWNNLGFALEMQSQYQQALHYYQQASALATELKAEKLHIEADINIAAIYSIQDKFQEALVLLKSSYDRALVLKDPEILAYVNAELGLLYVGLGFDKEAIDFMEKAIAGYEALGWQKRQNGCAV